MLRLILCITLLNTHTLASSQSVSQNVFTSIYVNNDWGFGSGLGSTIDYTNIYREYLPILLQTLGAITVTDIGSGDWQFSKLIDWSHFNYTGIDCVKHLVDANNVLYNRPNIRFQHMDILVDVDKLAPVDVILLKDVIQHWPVSDIKRILAVLVTKCKYLVVTNCAFQTDDRDTQLGGFRPLSYKMPPLSDYHPILLFTFHTKETALIRGSL